jgi:putative ABC transport system permease protein
MMVRLVWSELRHHAGRAVALGLAVVVAAVSFSFLTAAASTSAAHVQGEVQRNLRPAYDLLVRPAGSRTTTESAGGEVRPDSLSGQFGGISLDQLARIRSIRGVAVAAPVAMVGYVLRTATIPLNVGKDLAGAGPTVLRLMDSRSTDNGLTSFPARSVGYVYQTTDPLRDPGPPSLVYQGAQNGQTTGTAFGPQETLPSGARITVCPGFLNPAFGAASPFADYQAQNGTCVSTSQNDGNSTTPTVKVTFPLLLAAVDPSAENALVGLASSVVSGHYLRPDQGMLPESDAGGVRRLASIPVLAASTSYVSATDQITVQRLPATALNLMRQGLDPNELARRIAALPGTAVDTVTVPAATAYRTALTQRDRNGYDALWQTGPTTYADTAAGLAPTTTDSQPDVWQTERTGQVPVMLDASDAGFRQLRQMPLATVDGELSPAGLDQVGEFDPARLTQFGALASVPLETYYPPTATGATAADRAVLGGRPLAPNANPAGYLQAPPLLLTSLAALPGIAAYFDGLNTQAPISDIRVRLGTLRGSLHRQLDQIAAVAAAIHNRTGLDVEITAGSSTTQTTVALPAGQHGRPALRLEETWVKEGVAPLIVREVDRKGVALFVLVLVVTTLLVANATFASARSRRGQIGLLRCLGWDRGRIAVLVLAETLLIALLAGVAGTAVSAALVALLGLDLPWWHVALVTPTATVVALIAAVLPAALAARGRPLDAVTADVTRARGPRHPRGPAPLLALAAVNVLRRPARAATAAFALGLGVAALTVITALAVSFTDRLAGSALGEFAGTSVRGIDYLSAALALVLGAACAGDVLYLNLRDRAAELATVRAVGWTAGQLRRLALFEATVIATGGGVVGAAVALATAPLTGARLASTAFAGAGSAAAAVLLSLLAAVIAITAVTRRATTFASALAEE